MSKFNYFKRIAKMGLTPTEALVALAIGNYTNEQGKGAHMYYATLTRELGFKDSKDKNGKSRHRTVMRAVASLVKKGVLERAGHTSGQANIFDIPASMLTAPPAAVETVEVAPDPEPVTRALVPATFVKGIPTMDYRQSVKEEMAEAGMNTDADQIAYLEFQLMCTMDPHQVAFLEEGIRAITDRAAQVAA